MRSAIMESLPYPLAPDVDERTVAIIGAGTLGRRPAGLAAEWDVHSSLDPL
jgi:phosphoglycerate dehydrogenase-like enzyme